MVEAVNDDGSYTIDGWTVIVDDDTEFKPNMGAIVKDVMVEVEGWEQDDGSLLAKKIELEDEDDDDEAVTEPFSSPCLVTISSHC